MSNKETKQMLQTICDACESIEKAEGRPAELDKPLRDLFISETHRFFLFMSASDGVVKPGERDYINRLFGTNLSTRDFEDLIKEYDIRNIDFEEDIPLSLKILAGFEAKEGNDEIKKAYPEILSLAFDFYKKAGIEFITCDRSVSAKEIEDLGVLLARKKRMIRSMI